MKHYRKGIVLCLAAALMLTGCQMQPGRGTETVNNSSEEGKKTEEAKTEGVTEQENPEETGTIRLRVEHHSYDSPVDPGDGASFFGEYDTLRVIGTEPGSAIIQALQTWADAYEENFLSEAAAYADEAKNDTYAQESGNSYYLNSGIKTERIDSQVVSLSLDNGSYRGGVHGDYWTSGVTFDTRTGKQLTLSDLGDVQSELKDYLWKQLEPDSDEYFENSEQSLEELIQAGDICWYLTGQGIQTVINPYEIAPFAAGQFRVLVPYDALTGMKADYIPDQNMRGIDWGTLPEGSVYEQDMDGDGSPDTLSIRVDYGDENNTDAVTICYNTAELTLTETLGMTSAYICKDNDTYYLLLTTYGYDDYQTTRLYEFPAGEPVEVFRLGGGSVQGCSQDGIWMQEIIERLGTYFGYRYYTLQDGTLKIQSDIYELTNTNDSEYRKGITPNQDIPVRMQQEKDGSLEDSTLRAGITIYPVTIQEHPESGTSTIGFELIDGTYGELEVQIDEDGRQYVNGIEQTELFDDLPYAG